MRHVLVLTLLACFALFQTGCTTIRSSDLVPGAAGDSVKTATNGLFTHDALGRVLATHVDAFGKVNYAALKADDADLNTYFAQLEAVSPDNLPEAFPTRDHELAYWINAYNATVLVYVLKYYPLESVLDVREPRALFFFPDGSGFFFFTRSLYGGEKLSLLAVEKDKVTKQYADPRAHFALNCASIGCPHLPQVPFEGDTLDAQLDAETREFLAQERNLRLDYETGEVFLSTLFDWYGDEFIAWGEANDPEFGSGEPGVLAFVAAYAPTDIGAALRERSWTVRFVEYDWGLNGAGQQYGHIR